MRIMKIIILTFLIMIFTFLMGLLSNCVFDSGTKWKDPPYSVSWIDVSEDLELVYDLGNDSSIGRVDSIIKKVGSDANYVVAQRNSEYYYIEKKKDHPYLNGADIAKGPFSAEEFLKIKEDLKLPEFTKSFE